MKPQDFVEKILIKNPHDRIDAKAALQHPWLAQFAPPPPPRRTGFACVMVDSLL